MIAQSRTSHQCLQLAALALFVVFGGCATTSPIVGYWVHAYEDDLPGELIFRPRTHTFAPAFARDAYDFRSDVTAIVHTVGPADGIVADTGRWMLSDDRMLTITTAAARPSRFDVAHVDTALLRLRVMR